MTKTHKAFSTIAALAAVAAIVAASASAPAHKAPDRFYPDPARTPGSLNIVVTQATIQTTICTPNYTSTIRPAASYTTALKTSQLAAGYTLYGDTEPSHYEEDHLISLELGGSPTDPKNLWPEPYFSTTSADQGQVIAFIGAHQKDQVENFLHREVCADKISLSDAQKAITGDWYAVYAAGSAQNDLFDENDDQ